MTPNKENTVGDLVGDDCPVDSAAEFSILES
jgi:hypothetical protein